MHFDISQITLSSSCGSWSCGRTPLYLHFYIIYTIIWITQGCKCCSLWGITAEDVWDHVVDVTLPAVRHWQRMEEEEDVSPKLSVKLVSLVPHISEFCIDTILTNIAQYLSFVFRCCDLSTQRCHTTHQFPSPSLLLDWLSTWMILSLSWMNTKSPTLWVKSSKDL